MKNAFWKMQQKPDLPGATDFFKKRKNSIDFEIQGSPEIPGAEDGNGGYYLPM